MLLIYNTNLEMWASKPTPKMSREIESGKITGTNRNDHV